MLVDETERASVVALTQAIKKGFAELKPQPFIGVFLQLHRMGDTGRIAHLKTQLLINAEIAVVDEISGPDAIDAEQLIPGLEAKVFTDRTRRYGHHECRSRLT